MLEQGPILLDEVRCIGNESSLAECTNNGWNIHNCIHTQDVVVKCSGTKHNSYAEFCMFFVNFLNFIAWSF